MIFNFLQGGIKAVVWTDTIQMFLMYGSIITLLVKGVLDVGGLDIVWERNFNSSRVEFFKLVPPDIFHLLPFKQIYLLLQY